MCREPIQDALDGRLPREQAEQVLSHSETCADCGAVAREHRALRAALLARSSASPSRCPSAELLSSLAAGAAREDVLAHLADCRACREDVVEVRALLRERARTEHPRAMFRARLRSLAPRRRPGLAWIGAAAAALFLLVLVFTFTGGREETPVTAPRRAAPPRLAQEPTPAEPPRSPEPAPVPARPAPAPAPEPPKSAPLADKAAPPAPPPGPPAAAPTPEAKPPAPKSEPTREKPRIAGTILAVAGALSTKREGEAGWQGARLAQARDFSGSIELRAESSPAKFRLGGHTVYLQRRSEIAVALEEGGTRVRLAKGEALFEAARGAFAVETAAASVAGAGARFLVAEGPEVAVLRGDVDLLSGGTSLKVSAGERVAGPGAPAKADVARRTAWTRSLEETVGIEAELMALQKGMAVLPDGAASAGRAIGVKGQLAAGQEAVAEARVQAKQAVPYTVWARVHWNHGVPPALTVQVHDHPKWDGHGVAAKPAWQWVRVGSYSLPAEPFRVRLSDARGGIRLDRILVTSDPEYTPE